MSRRLILANYGSGGDIEIDTTYAIYYTSSDGNVVEPYDTNVFGANIISNNYINEQGIISFDDPITTIGTKAFAYCDSLTSVIIPDSVTTIGKWAFNNCDSLTSVTIGNSVTSIISYAFYYCGNLTSVTIPDSVTSIQNYAFMYCSSLTSVYCKATTPPALKYTKVFDYNHSDRKIYVPTGSVEAYRSANGWSEYASDIVGYNFEENGEDSGEENGGNLITFTIDGVEYQSEQGMTWAVGCESSYNTDGFIYAGGDANLVIYVSGYKRYVDIGTSADPSTIKITNVSYTTLAVDGPM